MSYEVLLKEAHSLIDEIPCEKIEYVVGVLKEARGGSQEGLELFWRAVSSAKSESLYKEKIAWTREELYER